MTEGINCLSDTRPSATTEPVHSLQHACASVQQRLQQRGSCLCTPLKIISFGEIQLNGDRRCCERSIPCSLPALLVMAPHSLSLLLQLLPRL